MSTLRLSREIYAADVVKAAVGQYGELGIARIDLRSEGEHLCCVFSSCPYGEEITMCEFENYVIDLMNVSSKS